MPQNGVIDQATGDLLRAGSCDFSNDGSLDPVTEAYRTDVPDVAFVRNDPEESVTEMHRWDGGAFILVPQPRLSLQGVQATRLKQLSLEASTYADQHYDTSAKISILALYSMARDGAPQKTNRMNYLKQSFTWGESIIAYYVQVAGQIMGAATVNDVNAVTWDLPGTLDASDPLISLAVAIQIPD